MKRIAAYFLAVIYLFTSIGVTVHQHYCMNRLVSWSLVDAKADACPNCGMKNDGNCCKDNTTLVRSSQDAGIVSNAISVTTPEFTVHIPVSGSLFCYLPDPEILAIRVIHAPPSLTGCDRLVRHCIFLV